MKKIIFLTFLTSLLVLLYYPNNFNFNAKAETPATEDTYIPTPKISPDNPFYFLKKGYESIISFFTIKPESKAMLHLKLADKRLAELKKMIDNNKITYVDHLSREYQEEIQKTQKYLEKAENKGVGTSELIKKLETLSSLHQSVLERVYNQVPEKAKEAIKKAIEMSKKGHERAIESIEKKGQKK